MRRERFAFVLGLALPIIYQVWSRSGRALEHTPTNLYLEHVTEHGTNTHCGNLLGVQPFMVLDDYTSEEAFFAKMDGYLKVGHKKGWLNEKTIVVLPEYVGTWLVACVEKRSFYQAERVKKAMLILLLSNLFPFVKRLPAAKGKNKSRDSLFRMKAKAMVAIYHRTFATLARTYGVTIVAGSIVLPSPTIKNGKLAIGNGALYNASVVYRPDGSTHNEIVRKAFPTAKELLFTAPAPVTELPVFGTPAGKLGVLICADSWYPDSYNVLSRKKCDLIAVPSNVVPHGAWQQPWQGYSPGPAPGDVDDDDKGSISERSAWLKYALAGRMSSSNASYGLNVFFQGTLWDISSDGHTILVNRQKFIEEKHTTGASLVNFWL